MKNPSDGRILSRWHSGPTVLLNTHRFKPRPFVYGVEAVVLVKIMVPSARLVLPNKVTDPQYRVTI